MASYGRFIPRFPEKYMGDPNKIFFRSSWEITAMKYWDSRPDVIRWNSEEIVIPYLSPKDNKIHEYYPDFYVEYLDKDKVLQKCIFEVKPLHQSDEKHAKSKYSKDALDINNAKWASAALYCATRGLQFKTITERSLFLQKKKVNGGVQIHS